MYLKVSEKGISLTKNYCITISIQKISSIHKFILKIQQISRYHELKGHYHFWLRPTKNHWITFSFLEIVPACNSSFHQFIFEIKSISESHNQTGCTHFWPCLPNKSASTCKNSVHYVYSFLRYSQFYSPVTRLATPMSDYAHPKIFLSRPARLKNMLVCCPRPGLQETCRSKNLFDAHSWKKKFLATNVLSSLCLHWRAK